MAQGPLPGLGLLLPHRELSRVPPTQSQGHSSCQWLESVGELTPNEQGDRHKLQPPTPEHTFGIGCCVYGHTTLSALISSELGVVTNLEINQSQNNHSVSSLS